MESEESGSTSIASLAPQVLACILRCLPTKERLQSCALVCHTWNTAAIAATSSVGDKVYSQDQLTALSGWLQAYAGPAAAAVSSILLFGASSEHPNFTLPSQQLAMLRSLKLCYMDVTAPAANDEQQQHQQDKEPQQQQGEVPQQQQDEQQQQQQDGDQQQQQPAKVFTPVLTPELSALTKLSLTDCRLNLKGLRSLKHLSKLSLRSSHYHQYIRGGFLRQHCSNIVELTRALPMQLQLTRLQLEGDFCKPAVIEACSSLPALQQLTLEGKLTNEAVADLPLGLTNLKLECRRGSGHALTAGLTLTAEAAPRLRQMTALQELSLRGVGVFHPVVLGRMQDLRSLTLDCDAVDKGYAEPGLDVLTRLTKLHDIFLRADALADGVATPADIAALTSSSQLTMLDVVGLADAQIDLLFPTEQQLPQLTGVFLDGALLLPEHQDTLARAVQCCPRLTSMKLHVGDSDDEEDPDALDDPQTFDGLRRLAGFPCLQHLDIFYVPVSKAGWFALAALPSLKDLKVADIRMDTLRGVMAMTACRSLTSLEVETHAGSLSEFQIMVVNQAPAGSPPDTWCRIPAAVIKTAQDLIPNLEDARSFDLYNELMAAATRAIGVVQAEQQQEVVGLRQRTAALEAAQAEQQQQMREMQAALQCLLQGARQ